MSSGRWAKRGWAFQARADAGWALAGQGATVTAPNSGWTVTTRTRLAIATDRNRLAIPTAKERVWIAEGK